MRALTLVGIVTGLLVAGVACDSSTAPDANGSVECLTNFPGLRVDTACGADLRVVIDGREVPTTPRRIDLDGAVILPWPDWAQEGEPAVAEAAGATASFTVHPYLCQVVSLDCGR